jgi:hypothetical protein
MNSEEYYFRDKAKELRKFYAEALARQIEKEILKEVYENNLGIYK